MGAHKPSVELAPGVPLGSAGLQALLQTELDPVVVTVRPEDRCEWLPAEAAASGRLVTAVCRDADEGMSRSIRRALSEALRLAPDLDGALVALADQPMLKPRTIGLYLEAFARDPGLHAVAGWRDGEPVPPVLWGKPMFDALLALEGDQGGRRLLRAGGLKRALVRLEGDAGMDVDTPEDLAEARRLWKMLAAR